MERTSFILSLKNIESDFYTPYLNKFNIGLFEDIIAINIKNNLWLRLDDIFINTNKYFIYLKDIVSIINPLNIKYLNELIKNIDNWDSEVDIYIHEIEFINIIKKFKLMDVNCVLSSLNNIRKLKEKRIFENECLKMNLYYILKMFYNAFMIFDYNKNYIINYYIDKFTIKCIETKKCDIFYYKVNQNM